jgi:NTP pyrophosphatase (non-canonical NTP hydrolase)
MTAKRKPRPAARATAPARPGSEIARILADIKKFRDARDWKQYHDPKNLALCLSVEAAELLEVFLWKSHEEIDPARHAEELADVFYAAFLLSDTYGLDVGKIIRAKLKKNAAKYPVAKAKGSRKKYDEL